jgi:hypothetical protein
MEWLLRKRLEVKEEKKIIVKCSFYEIYLMELRDLGRNYKVQYGQESEDDDDHQFMQPREQCNYFSKFLVFIFVETRNLKKGKRRLAIEDAEDGKRVIINNLTWHEIKDIRDLYGLLKSGVIIPNIDFV